MTNRRTIAESYACATHSSNLRHREYTDDTDRLTAIAWSDSEFGGKLFRLKYANERATYAPTLDRWREVVEKKALARRWELSAEDMLKVANLSFEFWLFDICPVCSGHGVAKLANSPVLGDAPCNACNGTARRSLICDAGLRNFILDMISNLEERIVSAGGRAIAKLSVKLDLTK